MTDATSVMTALNGLGLAVLARDGESDPAETLETCVRGEVGTNYDRAPGAELMVSDANRPIVNDMAVAAAFTAITSAIGKVASAPLTEEEKAFTLYLAMGTLENLRHFVFASTAEAVSSYVAMELAKSDDPEAMMDSIREMVQKMKANNGETNEPN